ncbi:hypothetical protein ACT3SZ_06500 [Corynebacterium sp. AOP40-9SA-29]|uniref:hypothetical protein n=1 Tax=Corynebacterium sp. AOP40-9SA-29 TaxID=3457677 RepID=UPI004034F15D
MATTPNSTPTDLEFIGHIVRDKLGEQKWYQKIANTLTAIVGAIATILGAALSYGLNVPDGVMLTVVVFLSLCTALGVRGTRNGFSESQRKKLQQWQAEYIDARHTHDDTVEADQDDDSDDQEQTYVGQHRVITTAAQELTNRVDAYLADRRREQ